LKPGRGETKHFPQTLSVRLLTLHARNEQPSAGGDRGLRVVRVRRRHRGGVGGAAAYASTAYGQLRASGKYTNRQPPKPLDRSRNQRESRIVGADERRDRVCDRRDGIGLLGSSDRFAAPAGALRNLSRCQRDQKSIAARHNAANNSPAFTNIIGIDCSNLRDDGKTWRARRKRRRLPPGPQR
jgi:hypothetical protein